jgi:integrase
MNQRNKPFGKAGEPTSTPGTRAAYAKRYRQLNIAARRESLLIASTTGAQPSLTANAFVDYLLARRPRYRANSWRQVRRSAIYGMTQDAERDPAAASAIHAAISRLEAAAPAPEENLPPRTSSTKAKRCSERDLDRICFAALAGRSSNGKKLVSGLRASYVSGCRPCEWPRAIFRRSTVPGFQFELVVPNAKNTNGRSTGVLRTLRWETLPEDVLVDLMNWIAIARGPHYERLLATLGSLLARLTAELFPRRKTQPTLYSMRHEATARWKAAYLSADQSNEERVTGLAIVAALLGHISDETASKHYGRPRRGEREIAQFPVPHADPAEVSKVRQRLDLDRLMKRPQNMATVL